ncbi:MAG: ATP-binding protein [Pseudomonadota bacterium]
MTDDRRLGQIASVAAAEPLGSALYILHIGLLLFAAAGAVALFDAWWFVGTVVAYAAILTSEKATAAWAVRHARPDLYPLVLALLLLRAMAYMILVVSVWLVDDDVFKMAALALAVAATINIFVFHATYPQIIACVVGPMWLSFALIAANLFAEHGLAPVSLAAGLIVVCVSPYFWFALLHARGRWRELDDTRRALDQSQKLDALGKLVSGVSHDFNNILAVTLGAAELLKDAPPAERDRLADQIVRAAEQGKALSGQLLAFSRRSQLDPSRQDLAEVFAGMEAMLDRVMPQGIITTAEAAPGTPPVFVDRPRLETALLNLAINARDAMPSGGRLTLRASGVDADRQPVAAGGARLAGRYACIAVADEGPGVAEADRARIFDPFYTTKPVGEGSGLGLSMVHGFAAQSGGAVTLDDPTGPGAVFRLYLPAAPAASRAPQAASPAAQSGPQGDSTRHATILLVEDEPTLRDLFARHLRGAGCDVVAAPDGEAARDMLRAGLRPDMLVTDILMPGEVQGPQLAELARRRAPDIAVAFVSGNPEAAAAATDPAAPAAAVLPKPVAKADLLAAVQAALAARKTRLVG